MKLRRVGYQRPGCSCPSSDGACERRHRDGHWYPWSPAHRSLEKVDWYVLTGGWSAVREGDVALRNKNEPYVHSCGTQIHNTYLCTSSACVLSRKKKRLKKKNTVVIDWEVERNEGGGWDAAKVGHWIYIKCFLNFNVILNWITGSFHSYKSYHIVRGLTYEICSTIKCCISIFQCQTYAQSNHRHKDFQGGLYASP